jgi:hypothetical protein
MKPRKWNRKYRLLLTALLLPLLPAPAAPAADAPQPDPGLSQACVEPPAGLVAWWPFDEAGGGTARDLILANNGAWNGNPTPSPAVVDGGLSFDGVEDFVAVPDDDVLNPGQGDFSVDFWIQTTHADGLQSIVDKRFVSSFQVVGYQVFLFHGRVGLQLSDGTHSNYVSNVFVADGHMHHVAVTVDRDDPQGIRFYRNGVQVGPAGNPTPRSGNLKNSAPLRIGGSSDKFFPAFFDGVLDELEIFKRALGPFEVARIAFADGAGKCKCREAPCGLVAWWPLDDQVLTGQAAEIAEHLSGPHTGTAEGATPTTGTVQGAFRFDGQDDRVRIPASSALSIDLEESASFSIDAWIKTAASTGFRPVVSSTFPHPVDFGNSGYYLFLSDGVPGFEVESFDFSNPFPITVAGGTCPTCPSLADDAWHLLGATVNWDAGGGSFVVRLYVDGELAATFPPVNMVGSALGGDVILGALLSRPSFFFEGKIDEVEIFNRLLVEADFSTLYAAGPAGKCKEGLPPRVCGTRGAGPCPAGQFCDFPEEAQCGAFDAPGVCRDRPELCLTEFDPVCGCDGQTYSNACFANVSGVSVLHPGPC